jgi:hypothetical protein
MVNSLKLNDDDVYINKFIQDENKKSQILKVGSLSIKKIKCSGVITCQFLLQPRIHH